MCFRYHYSSVSLSRRWDQCFQRELSNYDLAEKTVFGQSEKIKLDHCIFLYQYTWIASTMSKTPCLEVHCALFTKKPWYISPLLPPLQVWVLAIKISLPLTFWWKHCRKWMIIIFFFFIVLLVIKCMMSSIAAQSLLWNIAT